METSREAGAVRSAMDVTTHARETNSPREASEPPPAFQLEEARETRSSWRREDQRETIAIEGRAALM